MNRLAFVAPFLGAAFIGCSSAVEITSSWNDNTVVVDGSNTDWRTSLHPIAEPPVVIGVRNDDRFIYVCLTTQSPMIQAQILNGGLTVWFDPKGEQEEVFGVRYPIHGDNSPHWNPRVPLAPSFPILQQSYREFAIVGPDGGEELFSVVEAGGIKVKLGAPEGLLVYELQVPLRASAEFRYSVGISESPAVGIGFQTPELGSDRIQGPSGRASAGTRGGGRGGRGRTPTGAPIGGTERPESLDLWTKVTLTAQR